MTKYEGGGHAGSLLTTNPAEGATMACGHVAKGLIAPEGVEALCFDCGQRSAVVVRWAAPWRGPRAIRAWRRGGITVPAIEAQG